MLNILEYSTNLIFFPKNRHRIPIVGVRLRLTANLQVEMANV